MPDLPNTADWARLGVLSGAFWMAALRWRGDSSGRLVVGLALGAVLAHLGWLGLHADRIHSADACVASPLQGFCVQFLPLGPGVVAFTIGDAARRWDYVARTARVLPLALAVARLGCVLAGCCGGDRILGVGSTASFAWPLGPGGLGPIVRHPTALYDGLGLLVLHLAVGRAKTDPGAAGVFATGFGLVRLLVEPWRSPPPIGEPWLPVEVVAGAWVGVGGLMLLRGRGVRARDRQSSPGSSGVGGCASSRFARPRIGSVRHIRKRPRRCSSRA